MAHTYLIAAIVCYFSVVTAQYQYQQGPLFYPFDRRSNDVNFIQSRAANGYEIQVLPTSDQENQEVLEQSVQQQALVEYDPANVSLIGLVWDYLPSPIIAIKSVAKLIITKIWKLVLFLMPVNLVLLGMSLVVGFCGFTPYCTLIIEEPIASKIRAIRSSVPYIDELECYVRGGINRIYELQYV